MGEPIGVEPGVVLFWREDGRDLVQICAASDIGSRGGELLRSGVSCWLCAV